MKKMRTKGCFFDGNTEIITSGCTGEKDGGRALEKGNSSPRSWAEDEKGKNIPGRDSSAFKEGGHLHYGGREKKKTCIELRVRHIRASKKPEGGNGGKEIRKSKGGALFRKSTLAHPMVRE